MVLFGYIVSDIKYNDLVEDIVKVVQSVEECEPGLPKLIIGLENAKKYAKDNNMEFDILERLYPNGDMWTFKKTEKREYYEEDVEAFKKNIVDSVTDKINYYYIDIYRLKYSDVKRLYNILLNNKEHNYILIDKEMMYVALEGNKTMGLSFSHMRYIGIDREKVITKLRQNKMNWVYFSTNKKLWKLKEWFNYKEYAIPYLLKNNRRN